MTVVPLEEVFMALILIIVACLFMLIVLYACVCIASDADDWSERTRNELKRHEHNIRSDEQRGDEK